MKGQEDLICRCQKCNVPMTKEIYRTVSQRSGAVVNSILYHCYICGDKKRDFKNMPKSELKTYVR